MILIMEKNKIKTPNDDLSNKSIDELITEWLSNPPSDYLSMFPRKKTID
jgi:hypothetical protein